MKCAVDVEAGARRLPAEPVGKSDAADEFDERRVRRQDDVIEAVPRESAEIVPGGEASRLLRALEDADAMAVGGEPLRERQSHESAADDPDAH